MWRVAVLCLWPLAGLADVAGPARVIDGDTLQIQGQTVRLFGIDAPEIDQSCPDAAGRPWPCGTWAAEAAAARLRAGTVTCTGQEIDRYGRLVARCALGGRDIGAWLVADGIATAYRSYSWDYDLEEKAAQLAGIGIWAGGLQSPAAFRAETAQEPPGDCAIKGNISASGRIYHVPGQTHYAETRIDPDAGERWFCSEADALAAGWRPARR